ILQKDKAYSTLGIELKSPKAIETYNNNGNFSIKLTNINLQDIQSQSNNTLTKDSPLFIYIQDYKLNFITKLKDKQTTIKIPLDTTITKDKYNNINLQDTKLLFLSFIPFKDNDEANNTKAQKIQIESKDLEKQSITKQFKIPIIEDFKENEVVRGWRDEEDLNEIEVVGKNGIDISLVSEYSKNILRRIGKDSNNPTITITDVARTPTEQALAMYNMIHKNREKQGTENGIKITKTTYKTNVHSVIDICEKLMEQNKSKNKILNAMEQEIRRLIPLGYFQHCQDFDIKNTFDISVWRLRDSINFYKIAKQYEDKYPEFKIIDERRNEEQCYHIEITQP
ncbi:hypothetical protein, partial [Helicobacter sp. MIT 05-5294]|uniref:hypothetical protein n=1 Tax=Helicobacter sp. MIT 05-5294 TaxID=1548150 RepID=UPI0018848D6C